MPDTLPSTIYASNIAGKGKGASLAIRSLQPIAPDGELTISYTDITGSTRRRQIDLSSMYYFDCACEYCIKNFTCGMPDDPSTLTKGPPAAKILELEVEGEHLRSLVEDASPKEKYSLLNQAMSLFAPYKDSYPAWRHPWPSIRNDMGLLQWNLDHWSTATLHALKSYFFIDPILYPTTWHPIRIQRVLVLLKLIRELQYQIHASPDDNGDQVEGELKEYNIIWLAVNKGLASEIEAAIPKAFGVESSFAEEYRHLPQSESPEKYGLRMDWPAERAKLAKAAMEKID
ncbi:MAG: hypothetical protein Q9169_007201 [Polycauliona sp. 2 TL-2023]